MVFFKLFLFFCLFVFFVNGQLGTFCSDNDDCVHDTSAPYCYIDEEYCIPELYVITPTVSATCSMYHTCEIKFSSILDDSVKIDFYWGSTLEYTINNIDTSLDEITNYPWKVSHVLPGNSYLVVTGLDSGLTSTSQVFNINNL
eukprot:TRINITY_DN565_c0_g1_i1.p1 TRINITY_DN565_c0_g1~~TRINITY_DN565_c0_g1_i1.p1  ORF type:complete len:143 (-),score=21.37 TRINITY_DN565_c0_g1_i1:104-532(-)